MKNKKLFLFFIMNFILISTIIINNYSATSNSLISWTKNHEIWISIKESFKKWNDNGIAICTYSEDQDYPQICSDGDGGAIIVWEDSRSGGPSYIYAQNINSVGVVEWALNGTRICTNDSNQDYPQICSDGNGGAIITWRDDRVPGNDIYAQRINSSGELEWNTNGVVICNDSSNQDYPKICSDLVGGAIITWMDYRSGTSYDIYAQRINSDGIVQWTPNGEEVCTANRTQQQLQICSDNASGAIITWEDTRNWPTNRDIYAQRINNSGGIEWQNNGTVVSSLIRNRSNPQICSSGEGGAIITWEETITVTEIDIYAQKLNSSGDLEWGFGAHGVCGAPYQQYNPQPCSDGAGGVIITWRDYRNGTHYDIYAQRIKSGGGCQWTTNGVPICTESYDQIYPQICSDGVGGAIITWEDIRNFPGPADIYAQIINSNGILKLTTNGMTICIESNQQGIPQICSDNAGGAFITWVDFRGGSNFDIYAQRLMKSTAINLLDSIILLLANQTTPINSLLLPLIIGIAAVIVIIIILIIMKKRK